MVLFKIDLKLIEIFVLQDRRPCAAVGGVEWVDGGTLANKHGGGW